MWIPPYMEMNPHFLENPECLDHKDSLIKRGINGTFNDFIRIQIVLFGRNGQN